MTVLSVVVVTYRDMPGLRRTMSSVKSLHEQAGGDIEVLVADGGSGGPDFEEVMDLYPAVQLVSRDDSGIYDGMNRALHASTGDHIWFLNGGDESRVNAWPELRQALADAPGALLFLGYELLSPTGSRLRQPRGTHYLRHALPTSHQATFYPGDQTRAQGYDLSYRVSGDYALTARLWHDGVPARTGTLVVSRFYTGGTSSQQIRQVARDAGRVHREILHLPLGRRCYSQSRFLASRLRWRVVNLLPRGSHRARG